MTVDRQPVSAAHFLFALSGAMELATPSLARHQLRVAYIVWRMAEESGLPAGMRENLFLSALIHDLGAMRPEEKTFNHEQALSPKEISRHCRYGARLLAESPVCGDLSPLVGAHHEVWDGAEREPQPGHILHLAELFEHLLEPEPYILARRPGLLARLREVAPPLAGPRTLELFMSVSTPESFWLDLAEPQLAALLAESAPYGRRMLTEGEVESLGETFRGVIDFRSHFTATHSAGVLAAACGLARLSGFCDADVRGMRLAGALHDVGKMSVPNAILEKPGPLDGAEMNVMRQHTYHTSRILRRAGLGPRLTGWAAFHHERLDGKGYPFHVGADQLDAGARLMTVADIFTALAEDRPYRQRLERDKVLDILKRNAAGGGADGDMVALLERNYEEIDGLMQREQSAARRRYQENFSESDPAV